MTRLIDIDAVRMTFEGKHEYYERSDIDDAPTIEAIPIEFIESDINRMQEEIQSAMRDGDDDRAERMIIRQVTLQTLVEKWKPEREEE